MPEAALDVLAHLVGPGLGAEDAALHLEIALEIDAQFAGDLDQVDEVARRAADGGDAKILHDHDLAFAVAAGDRDDGGADGLHATVQAEAAGEQAVAEHVLHDVAAAVAGGIERAHDDLLPDLHVLRGVADVRSSMMSVCCRSGRS